MFKVIFVFSFLSLLLACGDLPAEAPKTRPVTPAASTIPTAAANNQFLASPLPTSSPVPMASASVVIPSASAATPSVTSSASPSASPVVSPTVAPIASTSPAPAVSVSPLFTILKQGKFRNYARDVAGDVVLVKANTLVYVRFKDFQCEPGTGLYVYAIKNDLGSPRNLSDFVSLGRLKSTSGDQNYLLPTGADPTEFKSIAIWSVSSATNFGFAPLVDPLLSF